MQIIRGIHNLGTMPNGCALTIGNFDGIHLGHQHILQQLRQKADQLQLPMAVMIFEPQPQEFFLSEKCPSRLMTLREKLYHFEKLGVDLVICVNFNKVFASLTSEEFINDYLINKLNVKYLAVGDDFRFGSNRDGNFTKLQNIGTKYGFQVKQNETLALNNVRISSSNIRKAILADDFDLAEQMLGRQYSMCGRVVHGNKLGRTIGFPTANIPLKRMTSPAYGVYAVEIYDQKHNYYQGVANIGNRPTINGEIQLLEVNIFNFNADIYGDSLKVILKHRIRAERKFPCFETLKHQIELDEIEARDYFRQK